VALYSFYFLPPIMKQVKKLSMIFLINTEDICDGDPKDIWMREWKLRIKLRKKA